MLDDLKLYTVDEVAETLRVNPDTVRQWINQGKLRALDLGKPGRPRYRIRAEELAKMIHTVEPVR